jgi:hypothetical protein
MKKCLRFIFGNCFYAVVRNKNNSNLYWVFLHREIAMSVSFFWALYFLHVYFYINKSYSYTEFAHACTYRYEFQTLLQCYGSIPAGIPTTDKDIWYVEVFISNCRKSSASVVVKLRFPISTYCTHTDGIGHSFSPLKPLCVTQVVCELAINIGERDRVEGGDLRRTWAREQIFFPARWNYSRICDYLIWEQRCIRKGKILKIHKNERRFLESIRKKCDKIYLPLKKF